MKKASIQQLFLVLTILTGLLLLGYTSYRAYNIPITHDEAQTFKLMQSRTYEDILNYSIPEDHMLNTLIIKKLTQKYGNAEWVLRLPNLFGHLIYLVFTFLILWRFGSKKLIFPAFILLNVNPYLLDFFSCARGYGLSTAFMLPSIYFILEYVRKYNPVFIILSLLFAVLGVLTLATLLNYYLVLICLFLFLIVIGFLHLPKTWWNINRYIVGILFIIIVSSYLYSYISFPISRLSNRTFVQSTTYNDFYRGTIRSLVFRSLYNTDSGNNVTVISFSIIGLYFLSFVNLLYSVSKLKLNVFFKPSFVVFIIGIGMALSVSFQFELFHIRFPNNRAAIFYAPIIVLALVFFLYDMFEIIQVRKISVIVIAVLAGLFLYNFTLRGNLTHYVDWQFDMSDKAMLSDMRKQLPETVTKKVDLGAFWIFEPSANYYRTTQNLSWLNEVTRDSLTEKKFDFYYLRLRDTAEMHFKKSDIIMIYPESETILLRRNN